MKAPPLLPEETLRRVLRVARLDGLSMAFIAGLFALLAALMGDGLGAAVGVLVAGAGAMELHGATLLTQGDPRGMNWLVNSQFFALVSILAYCGLRLLRPDYTPLLAAVTDEMKASLEAAGWTPERFVRFLYAATYVGVALATFAYQGGMAFYYFRRRAPVERALANEA